MGCLPTTLLPTAKFAVLGAIWPNIHALIAGILYILYKVDCSKYRACIKERVAIFHDSPPEVLTVGLFHASSSRSTPSHALVNHILKIREEDVGMNNPATTELQISALDKFLWRSSIIFWFQKIQNVVLGYMIIIGGIRNSVHFYPELRKHIQYLKLERKL